MGPLPDRERGGIPLDFVLLMVVIVFVVAVGAWYTVRTGGLLWLVVALVVGGSLYVLMRPVFRRRRVGVGDRRRQVGHDESWTSGKEEE